MANNQEEMRMLIIKAARDVFAKYGYRKTTMDDIADAIYKAKSSIYHYFDGKEDIFKAVVQYEADQISRKVEEDVSSKTTATEKLEIYFTSILEGVKHVDNYYKLLKEDWFQIFSFTCDLREDNKKNGKEMIVGILELGNKTNEFDVKDVEAVAGALQVAFNGVLDPWGEFEDDIYQIFQPFLTVVFNGITKK